MPKRSEPEKAAAELFGRILRKLREGRDYTAKEVAEIVGLKTDTILKYERGEREPSLLTMIQLSHLFGVSLYALITGKDFRVKIDALTSLKQVQDIVVVRDSGKNLTYVGPDRRQRTKDKIKGKDRRTGPRSGSC